MFADKTLTCRDCATQFVFPAQEQEFFSEKGFTDPVRCIACRRALKAKRAAEGGGPGAPFGGPGQGGGQGGGYNRGPQGGGYGGGQGGGYGDRPQRPYRDDRGGPRAPREDAAPAASGDAVEDEFPELRPNYRADPQPPATGGDYQRFHDRPGGPPRRREKPPRRGQGGGGDDY